VEILNGVPAPTGSPRHLLKTRFNDRPEVVIYARNEAPHLIGPRGSPSAIPSNRYAHRVIKLSPLNVRKTEGIAHLLLEKPLHNEEECLDPELLTWVPGTPR
jgi:hypothetical protein